MAASLVQSRASAINAADTTISLAYNGGDITAGNCLISVGHAENANTTIAASSSPSETWATAITHSAQPGFSPDNAATLGGRYVVSATGGATTNTLTFGASVYRAITILEVAGITNPTLGGTGTGSGTSSAPSAGSVTVSQANNICVVIYEGSWGTAITPPTDFIELLDATNFFQAWCGYKLNCSVGSQDTTAGSTTAAWVAAAFVIEDAAVAAAASRLALLGVG